MRRDHVRDRHLPQDGVGQADDNRVPHGGVGHEHLLDLARVQQLAAAVDHIVAAAGQEQETVAVEVAEVTGVQPAARVEAFGRLAVGVAVDDARAANPDLPGRPGRDG